MNSTAFLTSLPFVRRSIFVLLMVFTLLPGAPNPVQAQSPGFQVAKGFVAETLVTKLKMPTAFAFGPDGRVYIAEKEGLVQVAHKGVLQSEPFIDLRAEVNAVGQRDRIINICCAVQRHRYGHFLTRKRMVRPSSSFRNDQKLGFFWY